MDDPYDHPESLTGLAYAPSNVPGKGCDLDAFDEVVAGECSCKDTCTGGACACVESSLGTSYDGDGLFNKLGSCLPVVECNSRCACAADPRRCSNRVVQWGPHKGLQIKAAGVKGWGLFAPGEQD